MPDPRFQFIQITAAVGRTVRCGLRLITYRPPQVGQHGDDAVGFQRHAKQQRSVGSQRQQLPRPAVSQIFASRAGDDAAGKQIADRPGHGGVVAPGGARELHPRHAVATQQDTQQRQRIGAFHIVQFQNGRFVHRHSSFAMIPHKITCAGGFVKVETFIMPPKCRNGDIFLPFEKKRFFLFRGVDKG
ncbi:hypothetical protein SDC9_96018 [bioreactor metagenome]|uniref:Uncharacterized protein n=1 Tax=bioreactor metagenome TaxID=1076179 RepID=A0A645A7Y2_9ZZZZ